MTKLNEALRLIGGIATVMAVHIATSAYADSSCPEYLNTELRKLHSQKTANLCDFYHAGKPILVVNTASHCGFTKQFGGLEKLYQKYKDDGLVILGFPSDSFNQEEKSEEGTARVCYENYGVSFPMFEHVDVKGKSAHPVFAYLASKTEAPSWNFNKYLITDETIQHFGSRETPEGSKLEDAVKAALSDGSGE